MKNKENVDFFRGKIIKNKKNHGLFLILLRIFQLFRGKPSAHRDLVSRTLLKAMLSEDPWALVRVVLVFRFSDGMISRNVCTQKSDCFVLTRDCSTDNTNVCDSVRVLQTGFFLQIEPISTYWTVDRSKKQLGSFFCIFLGRICYQNFR